MAVSVTRHADIFFVLCRFVSKRVITNGSTAVTRPAEEGSRDSTTPLVMNREEEGE